ncbi:hypothetical protein [Yersinia pseudotuberculosis]|uniref:hypothetical protein n=1 Tax=Yersinia pseudotuberculosis TaxID=633 RepID=UPI001A9FD23E|nr:hypothetical protein [Yersinia pseudotuberculosis]MBO1548749.1 hypothetical protein [Yersinia pseudotuberculosis]MBO1568972.1 hypothetical protein [Yersinia pseudotuberculosis]MBO1583703.1 hypothetical protein [Yersinia pseudotuberculosis]MBO1633668.1 hypothetical protein [Yersinia pseudotuberculosis]
MSLISTRGVYLVCSIIVLVGGFSKYYYDQGVATATLTCQIGNNQRSEQALNHLITQSQRLTDQANLASLALSKQVAARQQADEQTTKELRYALRQTATQRSHCVFAPDILQQLDTARIPSRLMMR